jgi:hypothetical protein
MWPVRQLVRRQRTNDFDKGRVFLFPSPDEEVSVV